MSANLADLRSVAGELQQNEFQRLLQQPTQIRPSFEDASGFELLQRMAKMWASSALVPKDYSNNVANCAIALNMASRMRADPLMVMQNLVSVHGRPTWSAQFLIATVNSARDETGRRMFSPLRYEFFGARDTDGWGLPRLRDRTGYRRKAGRRGRDDCHCQKGRLV